MSTDVMSGATVAITGGTGSFGSTMAAHLLERGVSAVHIFSRDEAKQDDMRKRFSDSRLRFFLGDVRDMSSVMDAFHGADFVFHAAALKQVPSCEFFPQQAVKTNIQGSHNVIEAASSHGVRSVVCLSTDKAVYPVNAMGMSKALMEKTAQAFARNNPAHDRVDHAVRQRHVLPGLGHPVVRRTDQGRSTAHHHRADHDPLPHVPAGVGRPG
jgi:UDP-N-acetylglucosamine 4,6-dehydratase